MEPARWERMQALFHEAVALPPARRAGFLATACGADAALAADVLAMIEEDGRGDSLLDRELGDVAGSVLSPAGIPREIGPYRLLRMLGEGGMGVVYLAERRDLGGRVALKLLRDASLSPARLARFAGEQRTLAELTHPSIARLYDAGALADGTPWFAMEYVDGVPLNEHCRGRPLEETLRLFRAVCEAVQHAHLHAVIHRDLKPSNILVAGDGTVRLLDFGIAKRLDAPADRTRTGLRMMTPAYAAPEQLVAGPVGTYTDVYALGVILYELLTGRLPFDLSRRTPGEAEAVILRQEPLRPSRAAAPRARRAQWADLDVLCLSAMHKDPQRRYRSAEMLVRDVDHYLKGEPLDARPDSLRYRTGKFVRRHLAAVAAAALVAAAVAGLVTFYTLRLAAARDAALTEAARTQRIQGFVLNLFQGGDAEAGPSENLRVVTLLRRGEQEAGSLSAEPRAQAELYHTLGGIQRKLGDLPRAESLLQSALDARRRWQGGQHPDVAESLVALGLLRVDQANLLEAERLIREGLAVSQRALPPRHPGVVRAMTALGQVLSERGQHRDAVGVLEEALRLRPKGISPDADLASTLHELAAAHFYAGHQEAAWALNERLLSIHRALHGDRHPLVADALIDLGAVRFEQGQYGEAERLYRRALANTESWYGGDHHKTAANLTMLGRSLVYQGRYDEAVALTGRALAIQERVYGKAHPRVASALNELGNVAVKRGRLDEAEAHFTRMGDIYRIVHGPRHYLVGIATSNLAGVLVQRRRYTEAERMYRDAVRLFIGSLSPGHLNVGIARVKLGRTLLLQGRHSEAELELLAGHDILARQTSPSVSWLQAARKDLVAVYGGLGQPEKAARYREAGQSGQGR